MRVYKTQYSYYCGVDLHSRSLFVKVLHPNDESLSQAQAAEWSLLLKEEVGHVLIAVLEEWGWPPGQGLASVREEVLGYFRNQVERTRC